MSSKKSWKRLVFRWTALRGATALTLFFAFSVFIEYLVVFAFRAHGLEDTQTLQIPLAAFTLTISPLFHLMPLGVIVVLVSSWTYHTKNMARVSHRGTPAKKAATKPKKPARRGKKSRLGFIGSISRGITSPIRAFYHRVQTGVLRIRGVSPAMQRLFFARAAIRSTASVVLIFLGSFAALYLLGCPNLVHDLVVGFYRGNPSFQGFVIWTIETATLIGQVLSPIGWLASAANSVLISASSGFRVSFESFIVYATGPLVRLDVMWRYAICQNIATYVAAAAALGYGQYITHFYRPHRSQ